MIVPTTDTRYPLYAGGIHHICIEVNNLNTAVADIKVSLVTSLE